MSVPGAASKDLVTPGLRVGSSDTHCSGTGVYEADGALFATLVGVLTAGPPENGGTRPTLSVARSGASTNDMLASLPVIGATVSARITRITPRAAHAELLATDGVPLRDVFKGTIRQQDVRLTEIDTVDIYKCFRPGDVVAAEIVSLGDRHSYFLSTAKNELGVVYATSESGEVMVPVSWEKMKCPKSNVSEPRKVARQ
jgi:exosome complex component CSL4